MLCGFGSCGIERNPQPRNPQAVQTRTAACVFLYSGLASFPSGGIFFQLAGGSVLGMVDWIYALWLIFVIANWVE
ncbi:hypothetical protein BDV36DRAFT_248569 [Aspergillus pseudocaelatus]|uniref:Amino acid permease/ SLC12A domain-containing protein n=1 Tax=Aspergillus pseudocaelatus TaxID=1825620 RepID=A0ABQ6WV53_9EURO|nr:hypothetical protein BDV36DRAFT_248569 [Aspergillus pseudocaelatus]